MSQFTIVDLPLPEGALKIRSLPFIGKSERMKRGEKREKRKKVKSVKAVMAMTLFDIIELKN